MLKCRIPAKNSKYYLDLFHHNGVFIRRGLVNQTALQSEPLERGCLSFEEHCPRDVDYHDHILSGNQYLKTLSRLFSRFLLEYILDRMHSRQNRIEQNRIEQNAFLIIYTSSHVESKQNAFYSILFYSFLFFSILSRMQSKNVF